MTTTKWAWRGKELLLVIVEALEVSCFMGLIRSGLAVTKLSTAAWVHVDLLPTWPPVLPWRTPIRSHCRPSPSELRDLCHLIFPPPAQLAALAAV